MIICHYLTSFRTWTGKNIEGGATKEDAPLLQQTTDSDHRRRAARGGACQNLGTGLQRDKRSWRRDSESQRLAIAAPLRERDGGSAPTASQPKKVRGGSRDNSEQKSTGERSTQVVRMRCAYH